MADRFGVSLKWDVTPKVEVVDNLSWEIKHHLSEHFFSGPLFLMPNVIARMLREESVNA